MTLINRKQVRRFILAYAKRNRAHPFTRVSAPVYDQVEAKVREACRRIVDTQPSVGRTIN
jgi:hypothetical protein